jgi:hypothetical protein
MIITFYNAKINQSVVTNQKKVFEHFNIELNQIDCGQWIGHGKVIDKYLRECNQDWEYLILFDIDTLDKDAVALYDNSGTLEFSLHLYISIVETERRNNK